MAHSEHLAIIRKGVTTWNEWQKRNRGGVADLSGARLGGLNLSAVDLSHVNLSHADLCNTYLYKADLSDSDLREANVSGAELSDAILVRADLSRANLMKAGLSRAKLSDAALIGARLSLANLSYTHLVKATLSGADLTKAVLTNAYLPGAQLIRALLHDVDLSGADLTTADLSGADLAHANLYGAVLSNARLSGTNLFSAMLANARLVESNLENADLRHAHLIGCDLTQAILTGAKMYATARDDWTIQGVECRHISWDADGEIRSPKDRDLVPGEFERLYRTLPTIEYVFENGMTPLDPLIMDDVVKTIREQNPEYDLKIDSITARGLAPSIKLTVRHEDLKESALGDVTRVYEAKIHELAGRLDEARNFIRQLIDRPNSVYIENPTGPLAIAGSTINVEQHVEYITNLRDTIAAEPEDSPTFKQVAKKTALDILGGAIKDIARGQVKKAAMEIINLGKDLGPVILNTAAYEFFRNMTQGGAG